MDIKELYELYKECGVITTDSRNVPEGSMFLALKGESFDGNLYAEQALNNGAKYAIVNDASSLTPPPSGRGMNGLEDRFIRVKDTLQTFKDLAREHRRQFHIPVIGITGTNGKTTTKELIAAVLKEKYNVMYTQGNFNNDVGVPKTLFTLQPEHEIAIVEMGASHPGDIKTLVETAEPTCGLITNVGRAHLQGFGSFEGVKKTKGELYDFLKPHPQPLHFARWQKPHEERGVDSPFIFLNTEDADLCKMAKERGVEYIPYVEGKVTKCDPFLNVAFHSPLLVGEGLGVRLQLIGSYNLPNVLAAITVGRHFGVTDEQIVHALENYTPSNNRSQMTVTQYNHLIVDAYNANPTSMAAALKNFHDIEVKEPKFAILGDMRELGAVSQEEHQKIVDLLREYNFDKVWLVGDEFSKTKTDYRKFNSVDEVIATLTEGIPKGYYILIKGSNGIKLYTLPEKL